MRQTPKVINPISIGDAAFCLNVYEGFKRDGIVALTDLGPEINIALDQLFGETQKFLDLPGERKELFSGDDRDLPPNGYFNRHRFAFGSTGGEKFFASTNVEGQCDARFPSLPDESKVIENPHKVFDDYVRTELSPKLLDIVTHQAAAEEQRAKSSRMTLFNTTTRIHFYEPVTQEQLKLREENKKLYFTKGGKQIMSMPSHFDMSVFTVIAYKKNNCYGLQLQDENRKFFSISLPEGMRGYAVLVFAGSMADNVYGNDVIKAKKHRVISDPLSNEAERALVASFVSFPYEKVLNHSTGYTAEQSVQDSMQRFVALEEKYQARTAELLEEQGDEIAALQAFRV